MNFGKNQVEMKLRKPNQDTSRAVVLKGWSPDQQYQHPLGAH